MSKHGEDNYESLAPLIPLNTFDIRNICQQGLHICLKSLDVEYEM